MTSRSVAVIATPGFSPFHFSVPCIIFGSILPEQHLFDLKICAEHIGPVSSDIGITINVKEGLDILKTADIVIVPFWNHPEEKPSEALMESLIEAWQRGAEIVGLCLGTYVLAYAGLLDNRRAATHWESERDFKSRFPSVQLDNNSLYVDDDRLITSAGTAAGIDCCLYILRNHYGSTMANRVARRMVIPPYREGGQAQFIERPVPETTRDSQINDLLSYLRRNISKPQDLESLARYINMSRRTFTRHFFKATGMSPGDWINAERLQRSQELLETTDHSIEAVAEMSGFRSPVSFRQSFRAKFEVSPSEWRRTFRGTKALL
ncbi:GlxA family transcriptional regulator [Providencia rettgeri]|uniref:GlxA family transcriptional regulator n=1 Tax=Morganellaceae TaxID=1903414 RepID=UPI00140A716A|nr:MULTISPECIES: helix-turn-helix domain-containing protein [Morganellaceae]HCR4036499.1 helix-turn-helix domain-containing protein [Morganella morganii]MBG5919012.1 helix-turn-helix domain-containing protein [Providencia stuartii]MDC9731381.1 helix-turn-helix domain-containing protein [Proteus mirabilis]MDM3816879.1 helix-turn-helix domain-containing protein [Proteus mirabilis]MDN7222790.1 helix-turn-helix domain-containing protein [Providencia stuartii]